MVGLIGQQYSTIEYSRSLGQFRDAETKQIVPRSRVLLELDRETDRAVSRLQGISRLLISDRIDLPEFQRRFAAELKASHIRTAAMGAGGRQQLSQRHYGAIGARLRSEYQFLDGLAEDLAAGNLTDRSLLNRARMYADSIRLSFHKAEQLTKARDGFFGKRSLDSQAEHCPSCPAYATAGFVAAEEIKAIGSDCECRQRCRCFVVWRR